MLTKNYKLQTTTNNNKAVPKGPPNRPWASAVELVHSGGIDEAVDACGLKLLHFPRHTFYVCLRMHIPEHLRSSPGASRRCFLQAIDKNCPMKQSNCDDVPDENPRQAIQEQWIFTNHIRHASMFKIL